MKTPIQQGNSHALTIPQAAFDWYDEYAHGDIDRRTFLARLGTLGVAGLTLGAITTALTPNYALAHQVDFTDPDIKATYTVFDSPDGHGEGRGYLVVPTGVSELNKAPAVLVAHENRGLNPYIEDVARRLAKAGFIAFAPDALHPLGGYPGNDDDGKEMQKSLDRGAIEQDFMAAANLLNTHPFSTGKLGMVGFCFGGYLVNKAAVTLGDKLTAGVPFYGTPASEGFEAISAPLLIHFAALDKRVNATWPEYQSVLDRLGKRYTAHTYPDVNHGFHNDSTGRYNEPAAELAWSRTIDFFKSNLA